MNYNFGLNSIKNIPFDKYNNEFTFIVDGKRYNANRFIADLYSPIVCQFHYHDEAMNEFVINTKNIFTNESKSTSNEEDYFSDFLDLYKNDEIFLDEARQKLYAEYFFQLGNLDEFLKQINDLQNNGGILINTNLNEKLIKFCSTHFEELNKEDLKSLDVDIIEKVLQNESLHLTDEDSLLNLIIELYIENSKYSPLFEYVLFKNVSDETIEKFIVEFNIYDLNLSIWKSTCKRLIHSKKEENSKTARYEKQLKNENENNQIKKIEFEKGKEFEGIMNYLTKKSGGNIHDNETIEITSNSIFGSEYHPKNLVEYNSNNHYYSNDNENIFVCFDFKDKRIQPSCYSIKSDSIGTQKGH